MRASCCLQGRHALASGIPGFGSNANRSNVANATANNPGPGRYNTTKDLKEAFKPVTHVGKESVFGSQVKRFRDPTTFTPGPGQYSLGADLTRKSYNITYSAAA